MTKEEVIDNLKSAIPYPAVDDYQRVEEAALTYALELVEDIDEPENLRYHSLWLIGLSGAKRTMQLCLEQ